MMVFDIHTGTRSQANQRYRLRANHAVRGTRWRGEDIRNAKSHWHARNWSVHGADMLWTWTDRAVASLRGSVSAGARQLLWSLWRIGVTVALLAIGKDAL